jgi:hypothetical protein
MGSGRSTSIGVTASSRSPVLRDWLARTAEGAENGAMGSGGKEEGPTVAADAVGAAVLLQCREEGEGWGGGAEAGVQNAATWLLVVASPICWGEGLG